MAIFNVFSDPQLVARQQQLDAQWKSLNSLFNTCNNAPSSSWVEFVNDYKNWQDFFDSGSDWSASSKKATDDWQLKAQEWAGKLSGWGCSGAVGSVDGNYVGPDAGDSGIPGVKDPPPDEPGILDSLENGLKKPVDEVSSLLKTIGWVAVGLVVLLIVGLIFVLTKTKFEGFGAKVN